MSETSPSPYASGGTGGPWFRAASEALFAAAGVLAVLGLEWRFSLYDRILARLPVSPLQVAQLEAVLILLSVAVAGLLLRRWREEARHVRRYARVQAALRRSEALLAEAERIAGVGSWEYDVPSGRVWWSDGNFRLFGLRPGAFSPTCADYLERVAPEDRERVQAVVGAALQRGGSFQYVQRVLARDGAVRHQQVRGEAFLDERGEALRMMGVVQDVTERHQAERTLEALDAHLRRLVTTSPDGIYGLDAAGRFTQVNPAAEAITGRPAADLLGAHFASVVAADDRAAAAEAFRRVVSGEADRVESELRVVRPGGEHRALRYNATPAWEEGRIVGVQGIARDVTEWHAMEEQLRQAQKLEAVGHLAGGVAHDFNNALMVVRGFAALLADEVQPGTPSALYLDEIRAAATRSADVTRQLLAFSRRQVLEPRPLAARDVLEGIGRTLRPLLGPGIQLESELPGAGMLVLADPGQLEQVLVRLALNARDAMPDGGRLVLRAGPVRVRGADDPLPDPVQAGEYVRIQVQDTGAGMDEATLARAFEPFFTTKEPGRGTGLGLSSAYGIVHQLGGAMWAESRAGQGTCVSLLLPRAADAEGVTA